MEGRTVSDSDEFDQASEDLAEDIVDLFPGKNFGVVGAALMMAVADVLHTIAEVDPRAYADALECFRESLVICDQQIKESGGTHDRRH